jgi:hypothetical protein
LLREGAKEEEEGSQERARDDVAVPAGAA